VTLRLSSKALLPFGEAVLKAAAPLRHPRRPTGADIEVERAMWGPHPNPLQSWVEEEVYRVGQRFLRGMLGAVLGDRNPPPFHVVAKAESPKPPGWGEVMALFKAPVEPAQKLASWKTLVDGFAEALLPASSVENAMASWALRSAMLHQIGERIKAVTEPGGWDAFFKTIPKAQQDVISWSKLHGAEFVTNMKAKARADIMDALVQSEMAGGNHHDLSRVLFERLGVLNRDWRRIAITETGMAVSNGQLQAHLSAGGDWEAIWVAGVRACPFCRKFNGQAFRVVPADAPRKDPATDVWPGKSNVGRSAHLYRKDGTKRGPEELWVPCQPLHPSCACVWTIRRVLKSNAAKKADEMLAALRAKRFASAQ